MSELQNPETILYNGQQIRKLLNDRIGGRYEVFGMRMFLLWILNEESTGTFGNPLHDSSVFRNLDDGVDAIKWIGRTAAFSLLSFGPLVDHRQRHAEF